MDKALETMIANMPEKTGKSLEQWFGILADGDFEKHAIAVKFLKEQHGVTHGFANTIVKLFNDQQSPQEDLVALQYKGKEALQPIYDAIIAFVTDLGRDVIITPKKATVSVIRKHQFVLIKPATKTRIDLGLKLKGVAITGCLEASGPFGTMCTHRIQITHLDDFNQEVKKWITDAYQMSV